MKNLCKILAALALAVGLSTACTVPEDSGTFADTKNEQTEGDKKDKEKDKGPKETKAQENARESAESYLDTSAFSRQGLIDQLKFEGYSVKDATYGVDAQKANWKEQAAASAQSYLDSSSFSRQGLIDQLVFEGYTQEQAVYGVNQAGL